MDESETDHTNDSGVASSMDEANETVKETKKPIENKKAEMLLKKQRGSCTKSSKVASSISSRFEFNSDLIFNLDF